MSVCTDVPNFVKKLSHNHIRLGSVEDASAASKKINYLGAHVALRALSCNRRHLEDVRIAL